MEEHLACVENLDSDLVCARGFHLNVFDLELLACTPAYGSLALDNLPFSFRHDSSDRADGATHTGTSGTQSTTDKSREAGPSPNVISLNVLPKRLLQACKCISLIRTIMIPWLCLKKFLIKKPLKSPPI
jgi:hypothetical protein